MGMSTGKTTYHEPPQCAHLATVEVCSTNWCFASLSEITCALEFVALLCQAEAASVGSLAPD